MNSKILPLSLILLLICTLLTGCKNNEKIEKEENNNIISYTIDGENTENKPTKEEGFIVNKIICNNDLDLMWDNDNWEIEFTKMNNKGRCLVDFTKDINTPGYRVTITSNSQKNIDSTSKATVENGTVIIYTKKRPLNMTGCDGVIEDNKVIINNINENKTCNLEFEKIEYNVTVTVYGGTSDPSSQIIEKGESGIFTISASPYFILSSATVSGEGCTLSSDKRTLTVSNITKDTTCNVTLNSSYPKCNTLGSNLVRVHDSSSSCETKCGYCKTCIYDYYNSGPGLGYACGHNPW